MIKAVLMREKVGVFTDDKQSPDKIAAALLGGSCYAAPQIDAVQVNPNPLVLHTAKRPEVIITADMLPPDIGSAAVVRLLELYAVPGEVRLERWIQDHFS